MELRIVYMGTPDFAVFPLRKLVESGYNIVGVVTNPDKPAGRGQKLQESAVKKYALQKGLKILQPTKFKDPQFLQELKELKADLQIVVAFKMLPEIVWDMPPLGTINLHASLLPDYRGAAPIEWAIMNGEKASGVTTFKLSHEIDTGQIIYQEKVDIPEDMIAGELHDMLMVVGSEVLLRTVQAIEKNNYLLIEQPLKEGLKIAPKIFKEDMKIDWNKSIEDVYNHIRGLSPFPGAWTELLETSGKSVSPVKIFKAEKIVGESNTEKPGTIETDGKNIFDVIVRGGKIRILELQLPGKRRMNISDFLRGFSLSDFYLR